MYGKIAAGLVAGLFILALSLFGQLMQNVDADEVVVIQSPAGALHWHTTPGWKWQGFGKVTIYHKRSLYAIDTKMRFNDGAHGNLIGSIQYEMPTDDLNLTALHVRFGSQEAIQNQLVKTIVDKAVYMTGPLMSSKESYAERRNQLIAYVEDQVEKGVYQTRQRDERQKDSITGVEKTVTVVEIVTDNGIPKRQEAAVLTPFGIKPFNFAISSLDYEEQVERQIQAQQQATMDVQTAMAEAKKAEQRALTVAKQGEAIAAEAKWRQEAIKAQAVTLAEQEKQVAETAALKEKNVAETAANQRLEVARLDASAADQYRVKKLREAEGDAAYKREVLKADGALQQKLATYERINNVWAQAYASRKVPQMVLGANGHNGQGSDGDTSTFMNMMNVWAAKSLALNMAVPE